MKMREELAATTFPKWFGMVQKKLEETDPDDTGYCVGGTLSIADLLVRFFSFGSDGRGGRQMFAVLRVVS